ncbi:hypothetical protein GCM10012320_20450 [Sinomonas cellulolyticus]|nr:hypothetical protein GCM10012320_20450 [Sinomonas sp. KCTC 49339]
MSAVAGTPGMDSPNASVMTGWPPTVTRTITALRWSFAIVSVTIVRTLAASWGSADDGGLAADVVLSPWAGAGVQAPSASITALSAVMTSGARLGRVTAAPSA